MLLIVNYELNKIKFKLFYLIGVV